MSRLLEAGSTGTIQAPSLAVASQTAMNAGELRRHRWTGSPAATPLRREQRRSVVDDEVELAIGPCVDLRRARCGT